MTRRLSSFLLLCLCAAACGGSSTPADAGADAGVPSRAPEPMPRTASDAVKADASTDLSTTPLSAADYRLYANIMSGAAALGRNLSPDDRAALEFARKVDAGAVTPTDRDQATLARARALQHKDDELARIQGIEPRYREVKTRIEALIGKGAKTPSPDDAIGRENLRFLEAYRTTIERLQSDVRDPLSRPPAAAPGS